MENNDLMLQEENKDNSIFANEESFILAQRMANALVKSTVIPRDYQNNISNVIIAIDMAKRTNMSPMMVMQNLVIIHGKPSWSSTFVIAAINSSNRYKTQLQFKMDGEGNNLSCIAYVKTWDDEILEGPKITMQMAQDEGWLTKNGSKWKTMPQVMIRYRAASFFGRLYCSDILMGVYTEDENLEIKKERSSVEVPNTFAPKKENAETKIENCVDVKDEEIIVVSDQPDNFAFDENEFEDTPFGKEENK